MHKITHHQKMTQHHSLLSAFCSPHCTLQNSATLLSRNLPPFTKSKATHPLSKGGRNLLEDSCTICILALFASDGIADCEGPLSVRLWRRVRFQISDCRLQIVLCTSQISRQNAECRMQPELVSILCLREPQISDCRFRERGEGGE